MAISQITSKSITDSTITSDDIATGAVESSMTTQIGGSRNKIINGNMVIDQRNSGASVTITNTSFLTYTVDRWAGYGSAASKFTVQQSTTAPDDFNYSIVATSSSAYSVSGGEIFKITQPIEGFNTADLRFGTSSAKPITISFWVRSSLNGTFGGAVSNNGLNYSYPFSYTISSADTWEKKTITLDGATSGSWAEGNATGIQVIWSLGAGSTISGTAGAWTAANKQSVTGATSVVGTSGATWYITGVQLEVGTVATPHEHRSYGEELALCQRYYQKSFAQGVTPQDGQYNINVTTAWESSTNARGNWVSFPVQMRAIPTFTQYGNSGKWQIFTGSSWATVTNTNIGAGTNSYGFYPTLVGVTNSSLHPWYAKGDYTVEAEL